MDCSEEKKDKDAAPRREVGRVLFLPLSDFAARALLAGPVEGGRGYCTFMEPFRNISGGMWKLTQRTWPLSRLTVTRLSPQWGMKR